MVIHQRVLVQDQSEQNRGDQEHGVDDVGRPSQCPRVGYRRVEEAQKSTTGEQSSRQSDARYVQQANVGVV